jgi:hypothetical protein
MAIPSTAFKWSTAMDPTDVTDYLFDVTGLLDTANNEGVSSYTLTLASESVALGLTIGTGAYATSSPSTNVYRVWFSIDPAYQSNGAFDGGGTSLPMTLTITTNSSPARTRQRTLVLPVAQQ